MRRLFRVGAGSTRQTTVAGAKAVRKPVELDAPDDMPVDSLELFSGSLRPGCGTCRCCKSDAPYVDFTAPNSHIGASESTNARFANPSRVLGEQADEKHALR